MSKLIDTLNEMIASIGEAKAPTIADATMKNGEINRKTANRMVDPQGFFKPKAPIEEDAQADISANETAQHIATEFTDWLRPKNEETPLIQIRGVRLHRKSDNKTRIAVFSATDMGLDYPDLELGFGWLEDGSESSARGMLYRSYIGSKRTIAYQVVIMVRNDPREEFDMVFSIPWGTLVHEITHYLDFKRGFKGEYAYKRKSPNGKDVNAYLNDPVEFNAHYQQGLTDLLRTVPHRMRKDKNELSNILSSYEVFKRYALTDMPKSFHIYLNDDNKKKLDRRLYKLWQHLRDINNV